MLSYRIRLGVALTLLIALLAACNPGVVVPTAAPTLPVSPLPTRAATPEALAATPSTLDSPLPTPGTPSAGKAVAVGRLVDAQSSQPMINQSLSLAAVICPPGIAEADKREQCVYAIDIAFDPSALTDSSGRFTFQDIAAGEYVMIVGNPEAKHTVLANDAKQPLIWKVEPDQLTDFGELVVDLR